MKFVQIIKDAIKGFFGNKDQPIISENVTDAVPDTTVTQKIVDSLIPAPLVPAQAVQVQMTRIYAPDGSEGEIESDQIVNGQYTEDGVVWSTTRPKPKVQNIIDAPDDPVVSPTVIIKPCVGIDNALVHCYNIRKIGGDVESWIRANIVPTGTEYEIDTAGDYVTTLGTLPIPKVKR